MKPKLYLETTVPSYLTAWPSRDLIRAKHQRMTLDWWCNRREEFDLFISQLVLDEASDGDQQAAHERLLALKGIPLPDLTVEVAELAEDLKVSLALPARAAADAAHIAVAAVHGMHFLLTWNCTHIANAERFVTIDTVCRRQGFAGPVICTPEEIVRR